MLTIDASKPENIVSAASDGTLCGTPCHSPALPCLQKTPARRTSLALRAQAVSDLVESVALQQTALAHILNTEGEKIQFVVTEGTIEQMLAVNSSVGALTNAVVSLELNLYGKLRAFAREVCTDCNL